MPMYRMEKYCLFFLQLLFCRALTAQQQPSIRLGIIADVQYADADQHGTRHYRASLEKLRAAVDTFNAQQVDFVISLGDLIDRYSNSYDSVLAVTGKLRSKLYHTLGNHEFSIGEEEKHTIQNRLQLKNAYYAFTKGNWRFIQLNGNDVSLYANKAGSARYRQAKKILDSLVKHKAVNAYNWNGAVGKAQIRWLKKQLRQAVRQQQQVIINCHFPLYPDRIPELLWNASALRKLTESCSCVMAYFNGHVHVSRYSLEKNIHHVSFRGMVEGRDNAFAIAEIYPTYILVKGYGKELTRTLRIGKCQ